MKKIFINKDELNIKKLQKILQYHSQFILPELRRNKGYYDGVGQDIMRREYSDPTKPNNRIVKNYCKTIVENFKGYITGMPITYSAIDIEQDITPLINCLRLNDYQNSDSEWLKNALIYGYAPQLCYINENREKKFRNINPESVIPVYSDDLDEQLLYVIYYYPIVDWQKSDWSAEKYSINVYDKDNIFHYTSDAGFNSLVPSGEIEQHFFDEVPFTIFYLTDDGESIFKCIMGLQDAYNKMLSDSVNDWQAFVDAYMVLTNVTADAEDIKSMKENRVILLDDDSTATYLTKNSSDTQVQNLLSEINTAIHTIANSPDFSSQEFGSGVSSGIALQFKLVGFNNIASNIQNQFRKAIQHRVKLLNNVFTLVDMQAFQIQVIFTHNLPQNIADTADTVNKLRGLVSDETLLAQLPFVSDVANEVERVKKQNELGQLYDFSGRRALQQQQEVN